MSRPTLPESAPRPNWKRAAADFVSARIELLALELQEAVGAVAMKAVAAGVAAVCLVLCATLAAAGAIGWIAAATGMAWYFVALLGAAALLLLAVVAVLFLKRPLKAALMPLTRNEFKKDRAWLETLTKRPRP